MSQLRQVLFCLAATAALLTSANAAQAVTTVTIKGNLFYNDCFTAYAGAGVTIQVLDAAGNPLIAAANSLVVTIPTPPSTYTVTYDSSTLAPAKKFITINYVLNGTTNRSVQGVNGIATRTQVIHIGFSTAPGMAGKTPTQVTIRGNFTLNDGITPVPASYGMGIGAISVSATDTSIPANAVPNTLPLLPAPVTVASYVYAISSSSITPTDKTVILTFFCGGQTWIATGIVGGNTKNPTPLTIDIAFDLSQ